MKLAEEGARHAPDHGLDEISWLPPIPSPEKIICIGVNYPGPQHRIQGWPGRAEISKHVHAHAALLCRPQHAAGAPARLDAARLRGRTRHRHRQGRPAHPESEALDHIAAVTLCNEGTLRDWVRHAKFNVTQGKNFDSTGSLGPWLVPYTDHAQIADIRLTTRVNGETRQDDRTGRLIFGFRYLLNYISTFTTLVPGDVIVTGTPTGAGARFDPPRYLKPGDVIEVEAEGVGILRNGVVDEAP